MNPNNTNEQIENIPNPSAIAKKNNQILKKIENLQYLCRNFDPYQNEKVNRKTKKLLKEFNLTEYADNPFTITNQLLLLLDQAETELHNQ